VSVFIQCSTTGPYEAIIFNGNEQARIALGWKRGRLVVVTFSLFPGIYMDTEGMCTSADLMDALSSSTSNEFSWGKRIVLRNISQCWLIVILGKCALWKQP